MTETSSSDRTSVLLVHIVDEPDQHGGAEEVFLQLARFLAKQPEVVVTAAVNPGRVLNEARAIPGVATEVLPDRQHPIRLARSLPAIAREAKATAVGSHHRLTTWLLTRKRKSFVLLHTVHVFPQGRLRLSRWGDVTVCVSEDIRSRLVAEHRVPAKRTTTIINGVDDHGIRRREWAKNAPFRFAVIGRLCEQKGQETIVHAAARLRSGEENFEILLVGDGPDAPVLRDMIAELKVEGTVQMVGYRPVREVLPEVDAIVMPSRWEGTPLVLLEAWCAGIPVIASDIAGIREHATSGEAVLVPADNTERFAEAMDAMIRSNELRSRLSHAGRAKYESTFTLDRMGDAYLRLLTGRTQTTGVTK